ncbi:hypothetical protein CDL15_Pgr012727 [Punica granatum]|uniref:Uncharacterized protein n=1 Tax=Punica granatum TaxID=22663 RepID=A0A218XEU9_PUNGR|nr:hypothetical protein CDL15_Pgr012727 [Punica granatum]
MDWRCVGRSNTVLDSERNNKGALVPFRVVMELRLVKRLLKASGGFRPIEQGKRKREREKGRRAGWKEPLNIELSKRMALRGSSRVSLAVGEMRLERLLWEAPDL